MSDELDITIVTGLSGAGRSEAANVLEDLGFFVIDNLPPLLIPKVAELARVPGRPPIRYALGADVRSGALEDLHVALEQLREAGARTRIVFLEAADDVLVRRYEASRRKHPLASGGADVRGHRRGAGPARAAQGRGRRRHRHVEPQRPPAAGPAAGPVRRRAGRARPCRPTSSRSASSTASRSTSTSSSTAASSRTRTGSSRCGRCGVPTPRSGAT